MGWERRQRGGKYYYRSVRVNGAPRKLYVGKGRAAEACAASLADRRQQRQAERDEVQAEMAQMASADATLEDSVGMTDLLMKAVLLSAGYHEHRGQWRKRRAIGDGRT